MANRQCGRGRRSSGPAQPGMFARSKAPSRTPERARQARPAPPEPEMRRWPHPVQPAGRSDPAPEPPQESTGAVLHYIRCAMSYQNQLLADIKVLLEQMADKEGET